MIQCTLRPGGGQRDVLTFPRRFVSQIVQKLDLSLMPLSIHTPEQQPRGSRTDAGVVYTKDGVPVKVNAQANVRIGPPPEISSGDDDRKEEKMRYLKSAASIFGGLERAKTKDVITKTLEGEFALAQH